MPNWKYSVILGFLGKLNDRFSTYGEDRDIAGKFEVAAQIEGLQGLELVYPFDFADLALTRRLLAEHNLQVSTVNVNIKAEAKFHHGALTSKDPGIRREAVEYMQRGMDIAAEVGCNMITMCPLADGYDYSFEIEHMVAWRWFIDGVGQAAAYRPEVRLSLEYKQSEPRHKVILPNAGTSLAACLQVGLPNVGVTMDMGHALYAGESTAQAAALLAQAGKLYLVHVNDNYRNWDWDMIPGSVNPWDMVEMLLYLDDYGYVSWLTSDVAPFRLDAAKTFSATYRSLLWAEALIDKVGRQELKQIVRQGDPIDALQALQAVIN
ncbi:MAG: sugar phosphate isomerase/epimerase family protein [Chloroflexota bacterium]